MSWKNESQRHAMSAKDIKSSNPIVAIRFNDETKMRVTVDEWIKKIIQMTQMKGFRVEDRDFTAEDIEKLSFARPELITKFTIYAYGDSVIGWSIEPT